MREYIVSDLRSKEIRNPERIHRIIGILRLDGRDVEVHIPHYIEVARIIDTTNDLFTVKITDSFVDYKAEDLDSVYLNFVFSGMELFGKCRIMNQTRNTLTLEYPEILESRSKRRYPRVKLNGDFPASLVYKQYPEKKIGEVSSKDIPVKYSKLYWEVQRESVDIKKMFLLVGGEIRRITPHAEIILFNKENLNFRDHQILRKSGKVLFVDDCKKIQSYTRIIPSDKIVSYSYYVGDLRLEGMEKEKIIEELKDIVREKLKLGYTAMVFVPIFSKDEVIGAIKAVRRETGSRFTADDISDLMSLAALLKMGMEKAKFIHDVAGVVPSTLVDISEGGMFLTVAAGSDDLHMQDGTNIEVKFDLDGREVTLKGTVVRGGEEEKGYAVEFYDSEPRDRQAVKRFIRKSIEKRKEIQEEEKDSSD
jgi:hypothetical protein